jgi:cellulose biosynthesis protein BcsQ
VLSIGIDDPSLAKNMAGTVRTGSVRELVIKVEDDRFGGRLDILPACADAFLLDIMISTDRNRQATLECALEPVEAEYDVIVVDCPPSLGVGMDAAIYYARRRENEAPGNSGVLIPVQAEDSSADAFTLPLDQIDSGQEDWRILVDHLGLVVNLYDAPSSVASKSSVRLSGTSKRWCPTRHPHSRPKSSVALLGRSCEQPSEGSRTARAPLPSPQSSRGRMIASVTGDPAPPPATVVPTADVSFNPDNPREELGDVSDLAPPDDVPALSRGPGAPHPMSRTAAPTADRPLDEVRPVTCATP